ncbi:hypothetical protein ACI6QG_18660 [Roseococcus sp. DSY-14]|uniref:hypothetical protein n=1 Tax=Roseococcus sp. DSY-14 TaxID=3369650 RepID=UPI00387A9DCA
MRPLPLLLSFLLATPALAQAPAELAQRLPAEAAGWERRDVTDFESRPGGAGLGAAVEYRPPGAPGVATVFLYRARGGPEAELARAQEEIRALAPMRQYTVGAARAVPPPRPGWRCAVLEQAYAGGQRADSHVCVGAQRGWTMKLRVSVPAGAEVREVMGALAMAAGQAVP